MLQFSIIFFSIRRFQTEGESKYLAAVQDLIRPERNTLTVSFEDIESYNQQLATTILEEYYRFVQLFIKPFSTHTKDEINFPLFTQISIG